MVLRSCQEKAYIICSYLFIWPVAELTILSVLETDIFWQLTYGGTKYPTYTYVRKNNNDNSPVTDLASNDLRQAVGLTIKENFLLTVVVAIKGQ